MNDIIIKPIITEKMTAESEKLPRYGFIVDRRANKVEIKKAVKKAYDVDVLKVRTMNYSGKTRTRYSKSNITKGKSSAFKKAIVTLREGDSIDLYSSI